MIITCEKCNKKFNVDSNLIPDEGRLLHCSGCNYEWFFLQKIIKDPIKNINIENNETIRLLDETPNHEENFNTNTQKDETKTDSIINDQKKWKSFINIKKDKKKEKKFNILNVIIVFIISFTALIILLDTFKYPISKMIPNIEFILFNLYETIKDMLLFFKDLI